MCRDLAGRRLKSVNDELRLKKWLSDAEAAKREALGVEYREPRGSSGVEGWHLSVPGWSEGIKAKREVLGDYRRSKRKTVLCRDWEEARRERGAPAGAPRWWGCPRGAKCEFAHGEEELRSEAKIAAAEAARERAVKTFEAHQQAYTSGMYMYSNDADADDADDANTGKRSMLASVLAGLRAAPGPAAGVAAGQKRGREASAALPADGEDFFRRRARGADQLAPDAGSGSAAPCMHAVGGGAKLDLQTWRPAAWVDALVAHERASAGQRSPVDVIYLSHVVSAMGPSQVGATASDAPSNNIAEIVGVGDFSTCAVLGVDISADSAAEKLRTADTVTWYCEVELLTDGVMQLGWMDASFQLSETADGVGDDEHSWGYDGSRRVKLHGSDAEYGRDWEEEDVLGCRLAVRASGRDAAGQPTGLVASVAYLQNGEDLGVAFEFPLASGVRLFPAFSLEAGEVVRLNLGQAGFAYPPSDSSVLPLVAAKSSKAPSAPQATAKQALRSSAAPAASTAGVVPSTTVSTNADRRSAAAAASALDVLPQPVAPEKPAERTAAPRPPLELTESTTAADLELYTLDELKEELASRGLKASGTRQERVERLLAIKSCIADEVPPKLRGASFPGPRMPRSR